MKVGYYPGCSLESTAREYDGSLRDACGKLDIELAEIKDWNCCGATSAHCIDEKASFLLAVRNLEIAEKEGLDLAVPCSGCYSRLKFAEKNVLNNPGFRGMSTFQGRVRIIDILSLLSADNVLEKIESRTAKPLNGLKVAAYYGCMSLRPPKITDVRDCENPLSMERIIKATGAEPVDWSFKTICCGGGLVLSRSDIAKKLMLRIFETAEEAGADCLVTSCPMCQANLDTRMQEISIEFSRGFDMPTLYITELIGLALGSRKAKAWLKSHLVDPVRMLKRKGLI